MTRYLYVDGESHFIRTREMARSILNVKMLSEIKAKHGSTGGGLIEECQFFWDNRHYPVQLNRIPLALSPPPTHNLPSPNLAVYFTSFTDTSDKINEYSIRIRACGFEPYLVKEEKQHRREREKKLEDIQLIEKPKGVDIALTVRMIEDAVNNNYQECLLFTSDGDYLPVIRAVRRLGKVVRVFGYKKGVGNQELLYVPDEFVDIGADFNQRYAVAEVAQNAVPPS
jgi:uncharacterized LabA/DUF88 family protein